MNALKLCFFVFLIFTIAFITTNDAFAQTMSLKKPGFYPPQRTALISRYPGEFSTNPNSTAVVDSADKNNFYFLINLLEAGIGGGKNETSFLEVDFFKVAFGYKYPLLFGVSLARARYFPPSSIIALVSGNYPPGGQLAQIVSGPVLSLTYHPKKWFTLFIEGSWNGDYDEITGIEHGETHQSLNYDYKFLDIGVSISKKTQIEIYGIPMNRFGLRVFRRFASTDAPDGGPISGFYISCMFELGWSGHIAL